MSNFILPSPIYRMDIHASAIWMAYLTNVLVITVSSKLETDVLDVKTISAHLYYTPTECN